MTVGVFVTDKTGNQLVELDNASVSEVVWELNQPGSCQFTIPVDDPKLVDKGTTNLAPVNVADGGEAGTTTDWVTFGSNAIASSTDGAIQGSRSIRALYQDDSRLAQFTHPSFSGWSFVTSAWVYVPAAAWNNGSLELVALGGAAGARQIIPIDMSVRGKWQFVAVQYTAIAMQVDIQLRHFGAAPTDIGFAYIDQVQSEFGNEPTQWAAGGVTRETLYYPRGGIDEIQIWDDSDLMWWGLIDTIKMSETLLTCTCSGLLAYMHDRYITTSSIQYTSIDQFTIAWNLFLYAQTGADRDFNIENAAYSSSGKVRSRLYPREEHANFFDMLQEFPTLELGFDFDIDIFGDGRREFRPFHPRKGSSKLAYPIEWGVNVKGFEDLEDFVAQANYIYATGGSSGDVKFENYYRDDPSAAKYGEKQAVVSDGSQTDVDELYEAAQKEAKGRKDPLILPTVTTHDKEPHDMLKNVFTGDTIPVEIDRGRAQFHGSLRVNKKTWKPSEEAIAWELTGVPA